jgi:hypothetical protein
VIDEVDQQLEAWVAEVVPGASVSFEAAAKPGQDGPVVALHLLELAEMPPARGHARPPLQVRLGYLVTTWADDAARAHRDLGELLFAAMEHSEYEVAFPADLGPFWSAAGVAPRASFVLTVPLRRPLAERPAKPVRAPLVVNGTSVRPLTGSVVGPGDVPVPDAFVTIPALSLATRSDRRGRFRFGAVPVGPGKHELRVRAKAREFPFSVEGPGEEPVTLRLDLVKG